MRKLFVLFLLVLTSCGGLNYSQNFPGSETFSPKLIVALPVTVGKYDSARDIVEQILVQSLIEAKVCRQVIHPRVIRARVDEYGDFLKQVSDYIVKLNTLGVSDKNLAQIIGRTYQVQGLILTNVTDWGYGREAEDKVARVGLSLTLVNTETGELVWKGSHRIVESYVLFRPSLEAMCLDLLETMTGEMPINEMPGTEVETLPKDASGEGTQKKILVVPLGDKPVS